MGPPPRRISTHARAPVSRAHKSHTHLACCHNVLCLADGAGRDGFRVWWHTPSLPWEVFASTGFCGIKYRTYSR
jgi:hypothetical protein